MGRPNEGAARPQGASAIWLRPRRLLTAVVVVGAIVFAFGFLYYASRRDRLLRAVASDLDTVAALKAEQIEQWQRERLSDARFLAAAGFVARDVRALLEQPGSEEARRSVQDWLLLMKGGERYVSLQLLDRDRRSLIAVPAEAEAPGEELAALVSRAFAAEGPILSDDGLLRKGGPPRLHLLAPVFAPGSAAPREPVAVVLFRIDPNQFLFPLLDQLPVPSATGEILVARQDGDEAVFLNPGRVPGQRDALLRLPMDSEAIVVRRLRGEQGVSEGVDYRGRPVLAASRPISGLSWMLVAKIERDEAHREVRQNFWLFATLMAALIGVVAVVVFVLWRQIRGEFQHAQRLQAGRVETLKLRLSAVMQHANDIILLIGRDGRVMEANDRAAETYGYAPGELRGLPFAALTLAGEAGAPEELERLASGTPSEVEHRVRGDGSVPLEGSGRRLTLEGEEAVLVVLRDITARKRSDREVRSERRLYAALLRANEAALAAAGPEDLSQAICRALVDEAGMRLAWVGWVNEKTKLVEIETIAGPAAPYAEGLVISVDPERPESRGPTGRSLRLAEIVACGDFETDERMAPWREKARSHRIRSSTSVPLTDPSRCRTGALTVYAEDAHVFSAGPIRLLRQLAVDFAFGLRAIGARREQASLLAAVRESEQRYRSIFDGSHATMLVVDPADGRILDANPAAAAFYGWSREQLLAMQVGEINTLPAAEVKAAMDRVAAERTGGSLRLSHRRADGTNCEVTVHAGPVVLAGRKVLFAIVHDESERARAERRLAASEGRFRLLFAANPQPIYVFDLGSYRILDANEAALAAYGYTRAEFLALRATELREAADEDALREALRKHEVNAVYRGTARHRTKAGVALSVDLTARTIEYDGTAARLVLAIDVTERERTAERLRLQSAALDAADNAIAITDPTGAIEWVNEAFCRNTGYSRAELVGGNPRVLKSGRHPASFYAEMWATILSGRVWRGEIHNRRKDGAELFEDTTITPIRGADGGILHYIAIKLDITEKKRLEQQMLRSQRMEGVGLLAGGIAHDLNNILTPIQIGVDLLRKRATDPRTLRTLEVLDSSARRGAGIVRQVLTFARGVGGERVPLRPCDVLREIVGILEETFPRQIEIQRQVPADLPLVLGDPSQLHQVLLNLAVNARDAMPDGGRLVFQASEVEVGADVTGIWGEARPGSYVVLAVADTGSGMPPEVLEHVFDPFFTTKPHGRGTGLGLPTVLGIVRSHGGFIAVDSRPGEGTVFRVHLPAERREETGEKGRVAHGDLDGTGQTLLLCDDEPMIREITGSLLKDAGFKVIEATNGVEAVQRFLEHRSEISGVVTDIMMPLKSGDRAVAEMLRVVPRLPVVFMSGLTEEAAIMEALEAAPHVGGRLLRKPFTDYELFAAVREAGLGRAVLQTPTVA
jgi:two-component system, cell cycle sensor histidine kinase and response regulator CckA